MTGSARRAVSPVVGTILMVALVLVLATVLAAGLGFVDDFQRPDFRGEADANRTGLGLVYPLDDAPRASVRHRVEYPVPNGSNLDGDSLGSLEIDYRDGSVTLRQDERSDVVAIGVDTDGDDAIDVNAFSDVEAPSNGGVDVREGGDLLRIELGGNYNLQGGDTVVVVFGEVTNPERGVYPVSVTVNDYPDLSRLGTVNITA